MPDIVEQILLSHGPCLSSDLASALIRNHGLTPEAARQRISRRRGEVKSLAYITFPRRARFIYLQSQFGSSGYWNNLIEALQKTRSAYGYALMALRARQGIMRTDQFVIACGSPTRQVKHLSAETVLQRLQQAGLVKGYDIPGVGSCVALSQGPNQYDMQAAELHARLVCEDILLKAIKMWVRQLGFGSYEKVELRGEGSTPPKVGTFAWDLAAPSYVGPMIDWSKEGKAKPGFIACDVNLSRKRIDGDGILPFLHKCTTLRSLRNVGRCLQIHVGYGYEKDAFNLAKQNGVIPATAETLFGEDVAKGLIQLTSLLKWTAEAGADQSVLNQLFSSLGRIEGAAINLRGALFEFLVAEIARKSLGAQIELNRIFKNDEGAKAEVDVTAVTATKEVHFIECKGYQPNGKVDLEFVEKWLDARVPLIYKYARSHSEWKNHAVVFEIWTTGVFSEEAVTKLKAAQEEIRPGKFRIEFRDAEQVLKVASATKDKALVDTLRQHFLDHPISKAKNAVTRKLRSQSREGIDDHSL